MIDLPDYKLATNAAYKELRYYGGPFPKIDIRHLIASHQNIIICSYTQAARKLNMFHSDFTYKCASSVYGYTVADFVNDRFIIYYNDRKDETTIRFTLAHELGHIALRHREDNDVAKKEADCFARNILCPIQIIDGFNVSSIADYINCFGISAPMAETSKFFYSSDNYYLSKDLYDKVNDNICCYMTGYTLSELYGY